MKSRLEMYEIPLFPLNVVLFPGMPLPLHIFEERYKTMIADCIRENRPFGVVMIAEGSDEYGAPGKPMPVGCTAEIAQVQPLDEGRMFIMTVGRERFRVVQLEYDKPYLVGTVAPAPLDDADEAQAVDGAESLEPLVLAYLRKLARFGHIELDEDQIPNDPAGLAYLAATLIQLPTEEKQAFLAMDRASDLVRALGHVYRRELALMQTMPDDDIGIFSLN
jgi:Lon protease-like protein